MKRNPIKNSIIGSMIGVLILFALWFLFYATVANDYLIPSPIQVLQASFLNLATLEFYSHLSSTILRVLFALIISFTLGLLLAILSHLFKKVESIMLPILSVIRSLPILAVLLIILVFTARTVAPVIVCVLSLFPIVYSQTLTYLNSIDAKQKEMLALYKVPVKRQIFNVYLKGYLPLLIKEISTLFSFSLKLVISAEILANVFKSIGGDISNASMYANVTQMFSLTLLVCLIGIVVECIGKFICFQMEKKFQ